jgi:hypothetical protein
MSAWTEFSVDAVLNAMPTDMGNLYRSWVEGNPGKADRLSEIVTETVRTFREAVAVYPWYETPPTETGVPSTGWRHALNLVTFNLGMEMGVQFAPEVYSLFTQANIWLRMVQTGKMRPVGVAGAAAGTPSYGRPWTTDHRP